MSSVVPEIIPPGRSGLSDRTLDMLAGLLDDRFAIPGTNIRFGLDPIIGLIPGLGDLITGLLSFVIVYAGWQRGLPRVTVARMVFNIGIDTLLGTIPLAGDIFDVAWKSNRKNYNLLLRAQTRGGRQTWRDWAWFLVLALAVAAIIAAPIFMLFVLFHFLWPRLVMIGW